MKSLILCIFLLLGVTVTAQDKLPEWFLNPPVSPENSCVYLIGISDPGMNRTDATEQAIARAKSFTNFFLQKIEPSFASIMVSDDFSETVSSKIQSKKYHKDNFETVNTYVTNYNEVIVLVKYSFTQRTSTTTADSVQIKTMMSYYMKDDGENLEGILEFVSTITDKSVYMDSYYTVKQTNDNDSITSYYSSNANEFKPVVNSYNNIYQNHLSKKNDPASNQRFNVSEKGEYNLKNGLWLAYLLSFQNANFNINNKFGTSLSNSKEAYTGSLIVVKEISIKNNSLEVTFGGTLYTEGFITITYPEDVDTRIPLNSEKKSNRFALVIGNEDYSSFQQGLSNEVNVDYAVNDAITFHQYTMKTLGVPTENAILLTNARAVDMHKAIEKLSLLAKSLNGKAEIIFYYAGHGFPDDNKEAFLIPVDISGNDLRFAINLKELYTKLTQYPTQRVTVILDACFSGGARNQGLVAARAVKVRPRTNDLNGNLVVLAASSGDQSSLPFKEKKHGIFTYFLLKKLQETKGDITYEELFNHLQEQVGVKSLLINSKEQTPQANVSPTLGEQWKTWRLK